VIKKQIMELSVAMSRQISEELEGQARELVARGIDPTIRPCKVSFAAGSPPRDSDRRPELSVGLPRLHRTCA
jgi:hypothetical protein